MTVFDQNWLLGRNPRGGIEDLHQMKAANFKGIAVNVGDHQPYEWGAIRERARALGMWCGPWLHTRGVDGKFSVERLALLVAIARSWDSPVVVNTEKEIDGTGAQCTSLIAEAVKGLDAAISMEAWLFNPPSVDWMPVRDIPFALQIFPESGATDGTPFKEHAHACGIRCVTYTFAAYGGRTANDYRLRAPYSVYSADDIGQSNYHLWAPTDVDSFKPCVDLPEPQPEPEEPMAVGTAASAYAAMDYWFSSTAAGPAWRASNPGEWEKIQAYRASEPGTEAPEVKSSIGNMLVSILEAARYGEGTHA